jgi:hypothetical protein
MAATLSTATLCHQTTGRRARKAALIASLRQCTCEYEGHVGAEDEVSTACGHLPLHINHQVLPPGCHWRPCGCERASVAVRGWAGQLSGTEG